MKRFIIYLISLKIVQLSCSTFIRDCIYNKEMNAIDLVCKESLYPKTGCYEEIFTSKRKLVYRNSVQSLYTGNCVSSSLEKTFFESFANLSVLDVSHYGIQKMSNKGISLLHLERINVSYNKLSQVKASDFSFMPALTQIDVSFNKISSMDMSTFWSLRELKHLNLSHNSIEAINKFWFKNSNKLKELRIDHNPIKRVDVGIFSLIANGVSVEVSWNKVIKIDTSSLGDSLRIDLKEDKNVIFTTSARKSELRCPKIIFNNLNHLKISGSHLSNCVQIIKLLKSIKILDASSCFIGNLNSVNFKNLKNLEELYLSETNISNIKIETFKPLQKLKILDLSKNGLKMIDFGINDSTVFNELNELDLEGNQLTEINSITNMKFPKLNNLKVAGNSLSCKYLGDFLSKEHFQKSDGGIEQGDMINGNNCKNDDQNVEEIARDSENATENIENTSIGSNVSDAYMENDGSLESFKNENISDSWKSENDENSEISENFDKVDEETNSDEPVEFDTEDNEMTEKINGTESSETIKNDDDHEKIATTFGNVENTKNNSNIDKFSEEEIKGSEKTTEVNEEDESLFQTDNKTVTTNANRISTTLNTTTETEEITEEASKKDEVSKFETPSTTEIASKAITHRINMKTTPNFKVETKAKRKVYFDKNYSTKSTIIDLSHFDKTEYAAFIPKYSQKFPHSQVIKYIAIIILILSCVYFTMKSNWVWRLRMKLNGNSNELYVPYRLEHRNTQQNVELIEHLDFRILKRTCDCSF